jgi:periplasmic protein TonB
MGLLAERKVVPLQRRAKHARHAPWSAAVAGLDARVARLERRLAAFDRRLAVLGRNARFYVSLAGSLSLHAAVIAGVGFAMPEPSPLTAAHTPLEVTLVNTRTEARPLKPDALAQAHLDGGGNTEEARRAKSPLPAPPQSKPAAELTMAQERIERLEREAQQVIAQVKPQEVTIPAARDEPKPVVEPRIVPEPQPAAEPRPTPSAADIMSRSLQIARLEAQIAREWEAYQERPRRRFVGARTEEFRFARYIEDWRMKVERIGELNYPQAARNQRIYGSLVVTVSIKSDGSLEQVEINRSSGEKVLDAAALRIVRLAAPFAPFPSDIARDTDILSITRTWLFTRSDQFLAN